MLSQVVIDHLKYIAKELNEATITFPEEGEQLVLQGLSVDRTEQFQFYINRKQISSPIRPQKATFLLRARKKYLIYRLDTEGADHCNPDGTILPCPHLHILTEEFETPKWAYPIPEDIFTDMTNLELCFQQFLNYCKVISHPVIVSRLL